MSRLKNNENIPVPQWKPKEEPIPEELAEISQDINPETNPYLISFKYYNNKECQIKNYLKNQGRKALLILKEVGCCRNLNELKNKGVDIITVENNNEYSKLFNRLSPEVEMREHKIQSTSRMFYFITDKQFNVVAFTNRHYQTNKY